MRKQTLLWLIFACVLLMGAASVFRVYQGGTGRATLTIHSVLIGNGTSAVNFAAPSTSGFCFQDNGASADPTFQACGGSGTAGFATKGGVQTESYTCANDSGAANAYAITLSPTPSVTTYSTACFKAANSNTTASTLNVNGGGAVNIKKWSGGSLAALASGDIIANQIVIATYDGTQWVLPSGNAVTSVFARTGAVVAATNDYTCSQVTNCGYKVCAMIFGADNASAALADADIAPQGRQCLIPAAATVAEIWVTADGGTPNVVIAKRHGATQTDLLSSALATASSGGIACSNTGGTTGIDGTTTCSNTLSVTSLAAGDFVETHSGTAGGTAKRFSGFVFFKLN